MDMHQRDKWESRQALADGPRETDQAGHRTPLSHVISFEEFFFLALTEILPGCHLECRQLGKVWGL